MKTIQGVVAYLSLMLPNDSTNLGRVKRIAFEELGCRECGSKNGQPAEKSFMCCGDCAEQEKEYEGLCEKLEELRMGSLTRQPIQSALYAHKEGKGVDDWASKHKEEYPDTDPQSVIRLMVAYSLWPWSAVPRLPEDAIRLSELPSQSRSIDPDLSWLYIRALRGGKTQFGPLKVSVLGPLSNLEPLPVFSALDRLTGIKFCYISSDCSNITESCMEEAARFNVDKLIKGKFRLEFEQDAAGEIENQLQYVDPKPKKRNSKYPVKAVHYHFQQWTQNGGAA